MGAARRSGLTLLGAVLALTAMLGLIGLSGWHSAYVHDDDAIHAVSIDHDHGSSQQADPDGAIHVLAHATGQWVGFASAITAPETTRLAGPLWPNGDYRLRGGIEPSELLRPPRG